MEMENQIEEARRYVANAEEIIRKANYDPELGGILIFSRSG